jgi:hypothetical protein
MNAVFALNVRLTVGAVGVGVVGPVECAPPPAHAASAIATKRRLKPKNARTPVVFRERGFAWERLLHNSLDGTRMAGGVNVWAYSLLSL